MPCQKAWCAECYKVPKGSRFPIRLPKDKDRNVLVNDEDKTRLLGARVGDHVVALFNVSCVIYGIFKVGLPFMGQTFLTILKPWT
jgi:hypothetical protein